MNSQGEYGRDGQSEEESSHSMGKKKEDAQFHASPGPSSSHLLQGESNGLASGVDMSETETIS
eukprot:5968355-Pyramimonas_sp.AAC.1